MSAKILGIGKATPKHSISQREAAEFAKYLCQYSKKQAALVPLLYQKAHIEQRGFVLAESGKKKQGVDQSFFEPVDEINGLGPSTFKRMEKFQKEAPLLALQASREALRDSEIDPETIRHLVTVSCTGFAAPGFDITLIKELNLSPEVSRTNVGFMGCHGVFNGLRVASSLLKDPQEKVLLCSVELCSLHFSYESHPERIVANSLFADGAGAAVLGQGTEDDGSWKLERTGSNLFPDSEKMMTWLIGNNGFEMTLSSKVPTLITSHLKPWLASWLKKSGLTICPRSA